MTWQSVIFLSYEQTLTNMTASGLISLPSDILDAMIHSTLDTLLGQMQGVVNEYVGLIEECFDL